MGQGIIKSADEGGLQGGLHMSGRQDLKWLMGKVALENSMIQEGHYQSEDCWVLFRMWYHHTSREVSANW